MIVNQSYSIDEDQTLIVPADAGLLRGSSDVDVDVLVVVNTTKPRNGSVTAQRNGSLVYVPNPNYNGQDNFEFTVTDNQGAFVKGVVTIQIGEGCA